MRSARLVPALLVGVALSAGAATAQAKKVNYGDISHQGMKNLGPASTGLKLPLEIGLVANQQGIANAVKSASNPSSSNYGHYLSISSLQKKYGASSSRRNAVVRAFKKYGVKATVDVTHLRVVVTISIKNAQKLFGVKWNVYATGQKNQGTALPAKTPKLPSGLKGNIDTVSGLALPVVKRASVFEPARAAVESSLRAHTAAFDGGTPTRTGTISPGCATSAYPFAVLSSAGLFPNQILTAYGIAPLRPPACKGRGCEWRSSAPGRLRPPTSMRTAAASASRGRRCKIHGASGIKPILESSLDAMTLAMVAPKLSRLDLWVKALGNDDPQGVLELLADAAPGDDERDAAAQRHLDLLWRLRGRASKPYTAAADAGRPPARGDGRARDHDGRRRRGQRLLVVRARRARPHS